MSAQGRGQCADTGSHETTAGAVTGVFMKQYVGKNQALEIQGKVNGKSLVLTLNQKNPLDPAPWNDSVIGFAKQQRLFKDKQIEPGDQFSYLAFEPSINLVVTVRGQAKEYEVLDRPFVGGKIKVLRVERL